MIAISNLTPDRCTLTDETQKPRNAFCVVDSDIAMFSTDAPPGTGCGESPLELLDVKSPTEACDTRIDNELDPPPDPDAELEADAESLASFESGDGSDGDISELEYFRFSRAGLSLLIDLAEASRSCSVESSPHTILDTDDPNRNNCVLVDFEAACREKYGAEIPIGSLVGRHSGRISNELPGLNPGEMKLSSPSKERNLQNAEASVTPDNIDASMESSTVPVPASTVDLAATTSAKPSEEKKASAKLLIDPERQQDRLSCVINDILYRLNRQGVLADPRDVCRKGGGRSGDYYESDNSFFDDSLAYENLGVSPSSPRSRKPRGQGSVPTDTDEAESYEDSVEEDEVYCDYVDGSFFTFDDIAANDDENLGVAEEEEASVASASSAAGSDAEVAEGVELDKFVTRKFWVRRKAWRDMENKLSPELVEMMKKLEADLKGKGCKNGLYTEPEQVLLIFRAALESLFRQTYPKVKWDLDPESFVRLASLPEQFQGIKPIKRAAKSPLEMVEEEVAEKSLPDLELVNRDAAVILDGNVAAVDDEEEKSGAVLPTTCLLGGPTDEDSNVQSAVQLELRPSDVSSNLPLTGDEASALDGDTSEHLVIDEDQPAPEIGDKKGSSLLAAEKEKAALRSRKLAETVPLSNVEDLVNLHWPHFGRVAACFSRMSSLVQPSTLKNWWTVRLVLHNQLVYSALEARLFVAVVKRSPLFRTKGAAFFRNLKKSVDEYLKLLSSPATTVDERAVSQEQPKEDGDAADVSAKQRTIDSPFCVVATELLNWAIVYNCRRHELRELGETLEEWLPSSSTYISGILNACIEKRRRKGSTETVQLTRRQQQQQRVWVPAKYLEQTLERFKTEYSVANIYERRVRKQPLPTFVQPCKALFSQPPPTRLRKPAASKKRPLVVPSCDTPPTPDGKLRSTDGAVLSIGESSEKQLSDDVELQKRKRKLPLLVTSGVDGNDESVTTDGPIPYEFKKRRCAGTQDNDCKMTPIFETRQPTNFSPRLNPSCEIQLSGLRGNACETQSSAETTCQPEHLVDANQNGSAKSPKPRGSPSRFRHSPIKPPGILRQPLSGLEITLSASPHYTHESPFLPSQDCSSGYKFSHTTFDKPAAPWSTPLPAHYSAAATTGAPIGRTGQPLFRWMDEVYCAEYQVNFKEPVLSLAGTKK